MSGVEFFGASLLALRLLSDPACQALTCAAASALLKVRLAIRLRRAALPSRQQFGLHRQRKEVKPAEATDTRRRYAVANAGTDPNSRSASVFLPTRRRAAAAT